MRLILVIVGVLLTMLSIPAYYQSPHYLSNATHSILGTLSGGNMNAVSMLHQMGYPSMHQIISILQYSIIGLAVVGIGMAMFGVVAKNVPKSISVKLVTDEPFKEFHIRGQSSGSKTIKVSPPNTGNGKVMFEAVNEVLGKLETELKDMRMGYEDHKQKIENEKKKLEQRQREQLAKIIATGEVLIKEITPDKLRERIKHYVELKNEETGQLVDLSLLAEKFAKMKETMNSTDKSYISPSDFENMKRFLDE